ncbi:uncharacterized protein FOMMEDRAFT_143270 [Fomitiporia mediterranea MF3/22]|uniref:uncharacterized protein n=1 Tax=Fomitiporia mediterranea (strain MF3/22) TaxID=694068 RepID=UPI00044091F6|nr:uncharacterized protein FOMMEDRAFT_143270 [Fomitiporia mediterranea MF3/22]EJC98508.1 hypothetical protein FOMMEDRAFT_143270 [Fomitiporia mediterranea MF3/22]
MVIRTTSIALKMSVWTFIPVLGKSYTIDATASTSAWRAYKTCWGLRHGLLANIRLLLRTRRQEISSILNKSILHFGNFTWSFQSKPVWNSAKSLVSPRYKTVRSWIPEQQHSVALHSSD